MFFWVKSGIVVAGYIMVEAAVICVVLHLLIGRMKVRLCV